LTSDLAVDMDTDDDTRLPRDLALNQHDHQIRKSRNNPRVFDPLYMAMEKLTTALDSLRLSRGHEVEQGMAALPRGYIGPVGSVVE
jgi:hypothetical protein